MDCPLAGPIPADPGPAGEGLYARTIDGAYSFASRCLMDLVVREVREGRSTTRDGVLAVVQLTVVVYPINSIKNKSTSVPLYSLNRALRAKSVFSRVFLLCLCFALCLRLRFVNYSFYLFFSSYSSASSLDTAALVSSVVCPLTHFCNPIAQK